MVDTEKAGQTTLGAFLNVYCQAGRVAGPRVVRTPPNTVKVAPVASIGAHPGQAPVPSPANWLSAASAEINATGRVSPLSQTTFPVGCGAFGSTVAGTMRPARNARFVFAYT